MNYQNNVWVRIIVEVFHFLLCFACSTFSCLNNVNASWNKSIKFQVKQHKLSVLTLIMPNFLNEIILPTFLSLSIIIFKDVKIWTWSWSANSIEPGQTAWMCRLALLYTGGKGQSLSVLAGSGLNRLIFLWQRPITFGVGRIRVKQTILKVEILREGIFSTIFWEVAAS